MTPEISGSRRRVSGLIDLLDGTTTRDTGHGMNEKQASNVLRKYNKWRRDGTGKMQPPRVIGEAIDVARRVIAEHGPAMDTLRKIASGKRRTREQRLALSCVTFLGEC